MVLCAYDFIPPCEVEAKIAARFFMMHVMMGDGGHMLPKPMTCRPAWENFITAMPQSIFENHNQQNNRQRALM